MAQHADAWDNVRKIHRDYKTFYQGSGRLLLVVLGILVVKAIFQNDGDFVKNLSMEFLSIAATVLVLDWLAERRDERREEKALKERLVMEAGSQSNETAKRAIHELERRGWLVRDGGLLKGEYLEYANLQGADLASANLQEATMKLANLEGANLWGANLHKANLWGANLQKARLWSANLEEANLWGANLQNVNLKDANLQGAILLHSKLQEADLLGTNLQSANLRDANLEDAKNLESARFDENTILPDGSHWNANTELARFTDPSHPRFWRSDDPRSPSYRGKGGE